MSERDKAIDLAMATIERAFGKGSIMKMGEQTRVAIEAAHPMSWYKLVGGDGVVLGIERFGASAPYQRIYTELVLTVDKLVEAAKSVVKG